MNDLKIDSEYCRKYGYLFWSTNKKHETYKGGDVKDLNLLQNIKFRENKTILDVGGGNGFFSNYIKEKYKFKNVYNIEINKLLSEESKKKYKKTIITINQNILNLNFDNKVDVIIFFNSFGYLREEEYKKLFYKLKSFLNNDGIILINKHWKDTKKSYTNILKIKLSKIKENFFSGNFKLFTNISYLFSKYKYDTVRSHNDLEMSIKENGLSLEYNSKNLFFLIKKT